MRNKLVAFKEKIVYSVWHQLTGVDVIQFATIDEAISSMTFDQEGHPDAFYYIKSLNCWIFPEHKYFYPLLKISEYLNKVDITKFSLFNWDTHEDFYPDQTHEFKHWGRIPHLDMTTPGSFTQTLFDFTDTNIGIASFLYPFVWSQALVSYNWRNSSLLRASSTSQHTFGLDLTSSYFRPGKPEDKPTGRSLTYNILSDKNDFNRFSRHTETLIHTIDIDNFSGLYMFGRYLFSKRKFHHFERDMAFIYQHEGLWPQATLIATSPGFIDGSRAGELVARTLTVLKPFEVHVPK